MTLLARIREEVVLITLFAVWSAVVLNTFIRVPASPQMGTGQVVIYVLTVVSFSVMLSALPSLVILFGWYTGKKSWTVLAGVLPLPALVLLGYIVTSGRNMAGIPVTGALLFFMIPSAIMGCAGYCAALRTRPGLAMAIVLSGVWIFIVTRAFN
jgi:hypothetical protein